MPLVLLLLGQSAPDLMATVRARTIAEVRCLAVDITDVTVCGRRAADRFRAPLVVHAADRHDDVRTDRAALLHRTTPVQDLGPFLVGGGMAGMSATVGFGGSGSEAHIRPLAP